MKGWSGSHGCGGHRSSRLPGFPNSSQQTPSTADPPQTCPSPVLFHFVCSLSIFRSYLKNILFSPTIPPLTAIIIWNISFVSFNREKCLCEKLIHANNKYCGDTSLRPETCRCTYLLKSIVLFISILKRQSSRSCFCELRAKIVFSMAILKC